MMNLPRLVAPADLPSADARIPGFAVRVALLIVAVLLSLLDYGFGGWLVVGVLIAIGAAVVPEYMLALELPWRSWVDPAVFRAPLRRFLCIQLPTQLLAVIALLLLAPGHSGHRPLTVAEFSVIGAVALGGLALLLLGPSADEGR